MPSKVDSIFRITATQSRFLALKSNTNTATTQLSPSNKNVTSTHSTTATATTTTKAASSRGRPRLDWTPKVDAELVDLRMTHNKKWLEIGQQLGREPATCMNRFESTLNPALKGFWTSERDRQLDELVTASKPWADIANVLGVHRLACMARWRQLQPEGGSLSTDQSQSVEGTQQRRARLAPNQHEQQQQQRSKEQLRETQAMIEKVISNVDLDVVHPVDKDLDRLSWNTCLKDDQRYSHYRSWKKKARLDAFSQLYLINPGWSAKEETVLIQFVLEHGLDQWHIVAREGLKGRFTAAQCRTCWKNLDMPVVAPLASNVIQQEQQQQQGSHWYEDKPESSSGLASSPFSPSVSKKECNSGKSSLLIETVPSNEKENAWTREQQSQFWHLWGQHGQDWETIANAMDISMSSCKNYYANTTRHFHKDDNSDKDDNKDHPEVQERIWTLARTITQDFEPIASHSPASDYDVKNKNDSNINIRTAHSGVTPSQETPAKPSRAPPFIWDKELSVRLQAVVRQAYKSQVVHLDEINWLWVSRRVHPNATSRICKNHWRFLHDAVGGLVVWSQEDIRRLEEGVRLLGPKRLTAIREHFLPHMTKDDITRQWFRISDKATTIDEEEYYQLLSAVKDAMDSSSSSARRVDPTSTPIADTPHYNTSSVVANLYESEFQEPEDPQSHHWTEVEKRMGAGWKRLPCKRVWETSFQYLIRHTHWTNDEDTTLLRLVKFVGRDDWHSVAKAMQSGRSAWQCRLRWCQLLDPVDLDSNELVVSGEKYC